MTVCYRSRIDGFFEISANQISLLKIMDNERLTEWGIFVIIKRDTSLGELNGLRVFTQKVRRPYEPVRVIPAKGSGDETEP